MSAAALTGALSAAIMCSTMVRITIYATLIVILTMGAASAQNDLKDIQAGENSWRTEQEKKNDNWKKPLAGTIGEQTYPQTARSTSGGQEQANPGHGQAAAHCGRSSVLPSQRRRYGRGRVRTGSTATTPGAVGQALLQCCVPAPRTTSAAIAISIEALSTPLLCLGGFFDADNSRENS